jgi:hypothetical protein
MPMHAPPCAPVTVEVTRFIAASRNWIVQPGKPGSPVSWTPSPSWSWNLKTHASPKQGEVGVRDGVRVLEGVAVLVQVRVAVRLGDGVRVVVDVAVGLAVGRTAGPHSQPESSGRGRQTSEGFGHVPPHMRGATNPHGSPLVRVGLALGVLLGVGLGVTVAVLVGVRLRVAVRVAVRVGVGVFPGQGHSPTSRSAWSTAESS